MADRAVGHPLARTYQHLKQIYEEEKQVADSEGRNIENFRIRLLDRNEVLQRQVPINPAIHPHRTLLPPDIQHLAQVKYIFILRFLFSN